VKLPVTAIGDMENDLRQIRSEALEALRKASTLQDVDKVRVTYLGKKGRLTSILRGMGKIPAQERPVVGKLANEVRDVIESTVQTRTAEIELEQLNATLAAESVDITVPGRVPRKGHRHPLTMVLDEIKRFFVGLGYSVVEGPEVEFDYYNFEALNVPKDHPARDLQDTFYITDEILLRTQTSPVQVRVMEATAPPIRIIAPGKVYRCDADVTHSPMFHQVEGLVIDERITFGDLKGTLTAFAQYMFGKDRGVRFRPHYFPFTEPIAEMDIACIMCNGEGCRVCSHTGWLEVLGSGMVHPRVLEMVNYDTDKFGGFAFGMGVERIAMLKYCLYLLPRFRPPMPLFQET
jgi:phenylalanyl-tRNA synthetase alpha chain